MVLFGGFIDFIEPLGLPEDAKETVCLALRAPDLDKLVNDDENADENGKDEQRDDPVEGPGAPSTRKVLRIVFIVSTHLRLCLR